MPWTRARPALLAALTLVAAGAGCTRLGDGEAAKLVHEYLEKKIEAYKASDYRIVEPLVSDQEADKLLGLIGVKGDAGLTLDAKLLSFEVVGVERAGDEVVVRTDERWYYFDRELGSGKRIGPDSNDRYWMKYHLARKDKRWIVDRIEFERPPEVGRGTTLDRIDARAAHGALRPEAPEQTPPPQQPAPAGEERK